MVADTERSRIVVPWISPALEQPTTTLRGYAFARSASGAGLSTTSGAPKASTSVRAESRAGSALDQAPFSRSYDRSATWKSPESSACTADGGGVRVVGSERAGTLGFCEEPFARVLWGFAAARGAAVFDSPMTVSVIVWLCRS